MTSQGSSELSEREIEILKLVATGASNKEIAHTLEISPNTVKVHLRNIFAKIGVVSRTEAAMYAIRTGLVDSPSSLSSTRDFSNPGSPEKNNIIQWIRAYRGWIAFSLILLISLMVASQIALNQFGSREEAPTPNGARTSGWQELVSMPTSRSGLAVVFIDQKIYAIGGLTSQGITGANERYDFNLSSWKILTSKPTPVSHAQAAVAGGNVIIPGGIDSSGKSTDQVEIYDPSKDQWHSAASLPKPISNYSLINFEGQILLFGGWDGTTTANSVYSYDPILDNWKETTAMKKPRRDMGLAVLGGNAYLIGGWDGKTVFDDIEVFPLDIRMQNSSSNSRSELSLPEPRYGIQAITLLDNIYILGGNGLQPKTDSLFGYHYSQTNDQWGEIISLPDGDHQFPGVTFAGTDIYVLGGTNGGKAMDTVFSYEAINVVFIPLAR